MNGSRLILAALLVALLQIGFLGWSIADRSAVLRDGREVLLKVEPVDPRDLLRGDYVRLSYEIGRIPGSLVDNWAPERIVSGRRVVVRLAKEEDGVWRPIAAMVDDSIVPPLAPDQLDIQGRVSWASPTNGPESVLQVEYGIERFYLPEGEGLQIEKDMRVRPFFVKIAVSEDGGAQIKQFLDGDNVLYDEPLY